MADVQIRSIKDRGRSTPKVDLTPMVDLGFILITFFIYTMTLPKEIRRIIVDVPDNTVNATTVYADTSTITIMPCSKHQLAYYNGDLNAANVKYCSFKDMREIIISKQKRLRQLPASFSKDAHDIHVIIKPNGNSTYNDLVQLLDEMIINDVSKYAIVNITPEEKQILTNSLH